ncbi:hypothetical protein [Paraburkholderia sp. BL27I4N3]|uniref:hypothetical protein n=1 Tax=Paraburkholderia sp. BL27I4N3 TaxID=1938805 RepID=UPI000E246C79|nr:hypothetical protein [Paraburkholderia sp. BL27I4N3]
MQLAATCRTRHDALTTAEHEELTRLRRKARQLEAEREILAKAAAKLRAPNMALSQRHLSAVIHHSDQGCPWTGAARALFAH